MYLFLLSFFFLLCFFFFIVIEKNKPADSPSFRIIPLASVLNLLTVQEEMSVCVNCSACSSEPYVIYATYELIPNTLDILKYSLKVRQYMSYLFSKRFGSTYSNYWIISDNPIWQ